MFKLLKTKWGKIIIAIIWGLGISTLFRKSCSGRKCIVIKAVKPNDVLSKIFKYDKSCYMYTPFVTQCDKNRNIEIDDNHPEE